MTTEEMRKRLQESIDGACEIQALADTEKRSLTDDEATKVTKLTDEFDTLEKQLKGKVELEQRIERMKGLAGDEDDRTSTRVTDPESSRSADDGKTKVTRVHDRQGDDPKWGWGSLGEFGQGVVAGSRQGVTPDKRFLRAATTFGSEAVGADGGFAVPPDFRNIIKEQMEGPDSLLPLTDQLVTSTNNITVPKDETTAWQTSGGILANWTGEGGTITQSKPSLETVNFKLHKLAVLAAVTDELLEDTTALNGWLSRKAPQKINFAVDLAIVQGTGVGQPLGILSAAHTVSVAKVTSQDADTVVGQNIVDMWSRMWAPWRRNAVWLANQDIEPQLMTLMHGGKDDTGTAEAGWGVQYIIGPGQMPNAPTGTLFGRPIVFTQACETLGDKGDIFFAALDQYATLQKTGGVRQDTSIHLWFDADQMAFRFILRIGGQPWWNTTVSPRDGTTTYSAFVTLDARA